MRHLLLIPIADGDNPDPHGLLAEGPCGARVPRAYRSDGDWWTCRGEPLGAGPKQTALPLIWAGEQTGELGLARVLALLDSDFYVGIDRLGLAVAGDARGLWTVEVVDG